MDWTSRTAVLKAVAEDGNLLELAGKFRADPEVVLTAMARTPKAVIFSQLTTEQWGEIRDAFTARTVQKHRINRPSLQVGEHCDLNATQKSWQTSIAPNGSRQIG